MRKELSENLHIKDSRLNACVVHSSKFMNHDPNNVDLVVKLYASSDVKDAMLEIQKVNPSSYYITLNCLSPDITPNGPPR